VSPPTSAFENVTSKGPAARLVAKTTSMDSDDGRRQRRIDMTMHDWMRSLKPAAPARVHVLLAALMWTVVGGTLFLFGVRWTLMGSWHHVHVLIAVAIAVGLLKSRFLLDRAARRAVERIRQRGDGRCLGGFLSLRSWGFVVIMMICGRILRGGLLPRPLVGLLYAAVGTALLLSARSFWWAWKRYPWNPLP
jgi:hypothetical protein